MWFYGFYFGALRSRVLLLSALWERESRSMYFSCICLFILHAVIFVPFSSSLCQVLAAACDCVTVILDFSINFIFYHDLIYFRKKVSFLSKWMGEWSKVVRIRVCVCACVRVRVCVCVCVCEWMSGLVVGVWVNERVNEWVSEWVSEWMDWWSERPFVIKDQPIVWPMKIFDTFFIMLLQEHAWCPVDRETPCNLVSIILQKFSACTFYDKRSA